MNRFRGLLLALIPAVLLMAQAPTGTISGTVSDESGAVVPSVKVLIANKATGAVREITTGPDGAYSAPALPAGDYDVRAEATGFRAMLRGAIVETGTTTTVNLQMQIGTSKDVVTVEGATAN